MKSTTWIAAVLIMTALWVAGCLTAQTKALLAQAETDSKAAKEAASLSAAAVEKLKADLKAAQAAGSSNVSDLQAKLLAAQETAAAASAQADALGAKLEEVKTVATKERSASAAGIGATAAESLAPLGAILMPIVGTLLSALGAGLRKVQDRLTPTTVAGGDA